MKFRYLFLTFTLLAGLMLAGCNSQAQPPTENSDENQSQTINTVSIYTTLYPIEDFTRKIGGEHVVVTSIIPPGVDTHTFEPSTKTMIDIAKANAFIYNSKEMESYAGKISESLKSENVKIVEAASGINLIADNQNEDEDVHHNDDDSHDEQHNHGNIDPHLWIDPILSTQLAENIKNTLIELKPEATEEFEKNFLALKTELIELDHQFQEMIEQKSEPTILVSHAAYGYWSKRYGIKQIAVTGLSPSNEPSQKQLEEIIHLAKENKIKYVIFEQNVTPKISKIVQTELNVEALTLHNLEVLTEEDIKNGEDYFSLMRKNIQTLDQAMN